MLTVFTVAVIVYCVCTITVITYCTDVFIIVMTKDLGVIKHYPDEY